MPLMLTNFFYHKQAKTRSRPAVWSCKCLLKGKVPFVQSSGAATLTAFYVILIRPNRFIRIRFKMKRLMFVELQWSFIWSSRSRWCPDVFTFHQFRFKRTVLHYLTDLFILSHQNRRRLRLEVRECFSKKIGCSQCLSPDRIQMIWVG